MSRDAEFWRTEGINHLNWQGAPRWYEGEDGPSAVVEFTRGEFVRDIGCGYGRYAQRIDPSRYVGYDICEAAVLKARRLFPHHRFIHWADSLEPAPATMFINGPHLIADEELDQFLSKICMNTRVMILAEPMDGSRRGMWTGVMPYGIYTRNIEDYDGVLLKSGFKRTDVNVSNHLTMGIPYTVGRWESFEGGAGNPAA
jgi:SAM-dependent methyltransferase